MDSCYVEEVISQNSQPLAAKEPQRSLSPAKKLAPIASQKQAAAEQLWQQQVVQPLQRKPSPTQQAAAQASSGFRRETPATLKFNRELRNENFRANCCEQLTFELISDMFALELNDIFTNLRGPLPRAQQPQKKM